MSSRRTPSAAETPTSDSLSDALSADADAASVCIAVVATVSAARIGWLGVAQDVTPSTCTTPATSRGTAVVAPSEGCAALIHAARKSVQLTSPHATSSEDEPPITSFAITGVLPTDVVVLAQFAFTDDAFLASVMERSRLSDVVATTATFTPRVAAWSFPAEENVACAAFLAGPGDMSDAKEQRMSTNATREEVSSI